MSQPTHGNCPLCHHGYRIETIPSLHWGPEKGWENILRVQKIGGKVEGQGKTPGRGKAKGLILTIERWDLERAIKDGLEGELEPIHHGLIELVKGGLNLGWIKPSELGLLRFNRNRTPHVIASNHTSESTMELT